MNHRRCLGSLRVAALISALLLFAGCAYPTSLTTLLPNSSVLSWPFDLGSGSCAIENGYNTGPDHSGYELDSFDFQRSGGTTGQTVLSPVAGDSVYFDHAYPYDGSSGECVSISIDGHSGYHLMVCHLTNPTLGAVTQGQSLGAVHGGAHGDHIHITLYYLDPTVQDRKENASQRQAQDFSGSWTIAGCSYPSSGAQNEYAGTPVPCGSSGTTTQSTLKVAGDWGWTGPLDQSCQLSLQQSGAAITGAVYCHSGLINVTGSLSGHQISFQGDSEINGADTGNSFKFTGTVNDAATEMHGNFTGRQSGTNSSYQGTWRATR